MHKISLKKLKYDHLQVLKNYFEIGIQSIRTSVNNPEKSTVLASIAELYVMLTKKMLFADTSKLYTIPLTMSQAMAIVAYTNYIQIDNTHSLAVLMSVKQDLIKQLN